MKTTMIFAEWTTATTSLMLLAVLSVGYIGLALRELLSAPRPMSTSLQ